MGEPIGKVVRQDEHNHAEDAHHEGNSHSYRGLLGIIMIALSGTLMAVGVLLRHFGGHSMFSGSLLLAAMIFAGHRIALEGVKGLLHARVGINLLVTIAAVGATVIGHLDEGAAVLVLFSLAEYLEEYAGERAKRSIELMMELRPEVAVVRRSEVEEVVPVGEVEVGEVILLRPGDRVPLDGVVEEGSSTVNQAPITGESIPVFKGIGDEVYAGTSNNEGFLIIRVTKRVEETLLSKIIDLVLKAGIRRSPTEQFIDKFSRYYTPAVILLAVSLAAVPPLLFKLPWESWIYKSLIFLVLSCPCALAISTPVAMVSAITSSARNGVLIKGGRHIEEVEKARVFAFDKTGTLTQGELSVTDIVAPPLSEREVLRLAVALEAKSEHPIAKAILERAKAEGIELVETKDFKAYVGRGVEACLEDKTCCIGNLRLFEELGISPLDGVVEKLEAQGKTVVLISEGDCMVAAIALIDKTRDGVKEALSGLKRWGVRVEMLTGDNEMTARAIAEQLGLDGYAAGLLPEEKVIAIERLQDAFGTVIMVGDGINDAPALARANVGIAMGTVGSDVALETADVALMKDDLRTLPYLLQLSKRTMKRIKENVAASILIKALCGILVFPGVMTLWLTVVLGDLGLTLAVILNSLRLSRIKIEGSDVP